MATKGVALTVPFYLYDVILEVGVTGGGGAVTPRWVKDGVIDALTTPTVTELDATNAPGVYQCSISAAEANCEIGMLCGKSSSADVILMPTTVQFDTTTYVTLATETTVVTTE